MKPNKKHIKVLSVYLLLSLLLIIDLVLYYCKLISFRGYYSDVILFWLWFVTSIIVIAVFWKKLIAKLLLSGLLLALILSVVPMGIPFYALILSNTPFGLFIDKNLNENYRAQIVGYSVMVYPWLEIVEKNGPIEKRVFKITDSELTNDTSYVTIRTAKDIIFNRETDSTLMLTLFYGGPNKTITFNKNTGKISNIKTH